MLWTLSSGSRYPARLLGGAPRVLKSTPDEAGGVVGHDRVVDEVHCQRVLEGNSSAVPAGNVVGDDIVGDVDRIPGRRVSRRASTGIGPGKGLITVVKEAYLPAVDVLEAYSAAAATFRSVAHDQVGVDHKAGAGSVTQTRRAIHVGYAAAFGTRRSTRRSPRLGLRP